MNTPIAATTIACLLLLGAGAHADEGKDESGKGKQRYEERFERSERDERSERSDRDHRDGNSHFHRQGQTRIPNGHLPPPGECRVWYPNRPAGQQPPVSGALNPRKSGVGKQSVAVIRGSQLTALNFL